MQWTKFAVVTLLYLIFLYWLESWLGLIVVPFIFDVYITKKIRWQWWKDSERPVRFIMSWVDALVFALVAVYFINLFFFQNYVIPSSSLEKSLLTGDYLFVSKVSYGPRIPQTPLTMPLTQHTLPVFGCKSYIEWPQWTIAAQKAWARLSSTTSWCSTIRQATRSCQAAVSGCRLLSDVLFLRQSADNGPSRHVETHSAAAARLVQQSV